uniref:UDP-N-acetylglucosamine--dolichyl-phosphate N-acetylglucosaminephosphotransferase n=1 Tax=Dermatophagoides pteronyssinus TaxID=6956 RepID=A0A6P6YIP2_DERPT|nr:UDP-N-acetylglucosamine--dolichyl-phosphate N-acetylglucosaminephosphotransferase-like [Dermatophagoides pteronyssinus]
MRARVELSELANEFGGLFTTLLIFLVGVLDDMFDIRWRYKVMLPVLSTVPLLSFSKAFSIFELAASARACSGAAARSWQCALPQFPRVAWLARVLMCIFYPNAVNIYAGVNGLEVGQSLVIALGFAASAFGSYLVAGDERCLLTFAAALLFASCSYALFVHNCYPARVFVGDSYTMFAGIALSCMSFSANMFCFFLVATAPQIANFAYSLPQLLKLKPCPRHRTPTFNAATQLLEPTENYTLLNLWLRLRGPLHERQLVAELLALQAAATAAGVVAELAVRC